MVITNIISVFYEHIIEASEQRGTSIEDILREVSGMGITALECDARRLIARPELGELFGSFGMKVISIYMNYDFCHETKVDSIVRMYRHIDLCRDYGAEFALCVPGLAREDDNPVDIQIRTASMLNFMCGAAEKNGITAIVEDYDDIYSPCCGTQKLLYLLKELPALKLAFDTGNFAYCLEDALTSYPLLKGRITHVHLKERTRDRSHINKSGDNVKRDTGGTDMYPSPIGDGYTKTGEVIKALLSDGYKGAFSIEHFGAPDQLKYIRSSAAFVKDILKNRRTE